MTDATMNELKQVFFEAYDGFADKRIKNLGKADLFIVDDRSPDDQGADKQLYGWFCQIFVQILSAQEIKLSIRGAIPDSPTVAQWFADYGAVETSFGRQIIVKRGAEGELETLANAFDAIVGRGARYPVPSWKYVCPRIADSLRKLAGVLDVAWRRS